MATVTGFLAPIVTVAGHPLLDPSLLNDPKQTRGVTGVFVPDSSIPAQLVVLEVSQAVPVRFTVESSEGLVPKINPNEGSLI